MLWVSENRLASFLYKKCPYQSLGMVSLKSVLKSFAGVFHTTISQVLSTTCPPFPYYLANFDNLLFASSSTTAAVNPFYDFLLALAQFGEEVDTG